MEKSETTKHSRYESNPFTLSFNALGKLFGNNLMWALGFIGLALFWLFIQFIGQIFQAIITAPYNNTATSSPVYSEPNVASAAIIAVIVIIAALFSILIAIAVSTFTGGLFSYIALESNKGRSVTASEGFNKALERFWPLFKSQLLAAVKIFGWTLLFIIPGIVAFFRYSALPFVVMAENETSASKIHARTKSLVKKRLWEFFGIYFVASLIPIVGGLLRNSGNAALYQQLQVYTDGNIEKPKIHWLNYLGFIIAGAFILLSAFSIAIIFIALNA